MEEEEEEKEEEKEAKKESSPRWADYPDPDAPAPPEKKNYRNLADVVRGRKASNEEAKSLCKFYIERTCRAGSRCKFKHPKAIKDVLDNRRKAKVCKFFLEGQCRDGDQCPWRHCVEVDSGQPGAQKLHEPRLNQRRRRKIR